MFFLSIISFVGPNIKFKLILQGSIKHWGYVSTKYTNLNFLCRLLLTYFFASLFITRANVRRAVAHCTVGLAPGVHARVLIIGWDSMAVLGVHRICCCVRLCGSLIPRCGELCGDVGRWALYPDVWASPKSFLRTTAQAAVASVWITAPVVATIPVPLHNQLWCQICLNISNLARNFYLQDALITSQSWW